MLRSLKVVGLVALAVAVPSLASAGGGGGSYETSVTVDVAPLNSKCPAIMKIHGTTTLLNPDGKHFSATAYFKLGNLSTTPVPLDFSKRTTITWESDFHDPDLYANYQTGIVAVITDYGGPNQEVVATQGSFSLGCGMATPGSKPNIPAPVALTPNVCDDYAQGNLSVKQPYVMWTGLGIASSMSHSMYSGKKSADVDQVFDVIKHYAHMCSIPATRFYWFDGDGAKSSPNWGKCTAYDNSVVTVTNDATGWVVRAGTKELFRVGLEADARTLGNAVKHRTESCEIGEGTESAEQTFHYLR